MKSKLTISFWQCFALVAGAVMMTVGELEILYYLGLAGTSEPAWEGGLVLVVLGVLTIFVTFAPKKIKDWGKKQKEVK